MKSPISTLLVLLALARSGTAQGRSPVSLQPCRRVPTAGPTVEAPAPVYELRNGRWFDGRAFVDRTIYTRRGRFLDRRPVHVDSVIDLRGGFVVPPFGEAHNHHVEPGAIRRYIARYLADGIMYVMDLMMLPSMCDALDAAFNRPGSVDMVSARQGWTGPGGHPLEVRDQLTAAGLLSPSNPWVTAPDGNGSLVVRTRAEVDTRWSLFLRDRPSLTKVFLAYSEEYAQRLSDSSLSPAWRGIDPRLVPHIVRKSHAAGLRVVAHVLTAADFRAAVDAGVDIIAHLPGLGARDSSRFDAFLLSDSDARRAADRRAVVIPTIAAVLQGTNDSASAAALVRRVITPNVLTLKRSGVPLLIGSDQFRGTSAAEAALIAELGLLSPEELLVAWSVTTPRAIFPGRRIGRLRDGYEASLLVLDRDPGLTPAPRATITLRMQRGHLLPPP